MKKIHDFLENASSLLREDGRITALCAGGSWMTNELDEFSDLDLVLITKNKISDSKEAEETSMFYLDSIAIKNHRRHR
ncbi:MAG: hypothetical protein WAV76_03225 [Bacteroidota bacterium]